MNSLVSSKPATAGEAWGAEETRTAMEAAPPAPETPGPLASFARFLLLGGSVGVASSVAVAVLAALMPWALANALVTVASTLVGTELHSRFTFKTGKRAGWRRHLQSAGSAMAAYAVTSTAVLVLHLLRPAAGMLREQIVYLSAAALAGIGRFMVLRLVVFTGGRTQTMVRPARPSPVQSHSALLPTVPTVPSHPSRRFCTSGSSSRPARVPSQICAVRRLAPRFSPLAPRTHRRTVGSSTPGSTRL